MVLELLYIGTVCPYEGIGYRKRRFSLYAISSPTCSRASRRQIARARSYFAPVLSHAGRFERRVHATPSSSRRRQQVFLPIRGTRFATAGTRRDEGAGTLEENAIWRGDLHAAWWVSTPLAMCGVQRAELGAVNED